MADADALNLKELTADVVGAHVANNNVAAADLPSLIKSVYDALTGLGQETAAGPAEKQTPAVSIRSSVKPDYIVCLEDGKKLTMLKRYLSTRYGLTPDEYRQKWGLSSDYPMVAPNYAEKRRALANAVGLGRKAVAKVEEVVVAAAKPIRKRAEKVLEKIEEKPAAAPQHAAAQAAPKSAPAKSASPSRSSRKAVVEEVVEAPVAAPAAKRGRKPKAKTG